MKFTIELNPAELKEVITDSSLLALAQATADTDVEALAAAKIIKHNQAKASVSNEETKRAETIKPETKPVDKKPIGEKPSPETETYTLVQVREKLASLSRNGNQAEVKKLIEEFGATKLSDVKEEDYAGLMKKAEGL